MPDRPIVVITGANGFIGTHLVEHFASAGWQVRALVHREPPRSVPSVQYSKWDLAEPVAGDVLEGVDYLIHCAAATYVDPALASRVNLAGTRALLAAARGSSVRRVVYLSSMSARAAAVSEYGRDKFQLEHDFDRPTEVVIRPGLVLGDGGLFERIRHFVLKRRLVPLVGGGHQLVQTVFIDDLTAAIEAAIERDLGGTITVAENPPVEFRAVLSEAARQIGLKALFVPVPYLPVAWALSVSRRIGWRTPVSQDNLLGLKSLEAVDTRRDLERLGIQVRDYRASLRAILEHEASD